jgi:hypothetical protein
MAMASVERMTTFFTHPSFGQVNVFSNPESLGPAIRKLNGRFMACDVNGRHLRGRFYCISHHHSRLGPRGAKATVLDSDSFGGSVLSRTNIANWSVTVAFTPSPTSIWSKFATSGPALKVVVVPSGAWSVSLRAALSTSTVRVVRFARHRLL